MSRIAAGWLAVLPLAALVYAPLLATGVEWVMPGGEQWRVLGATVLWSAGVAVLATAMGGAAALALWAKGGILAALAIGAAALPAYLHALVWLPWLRGPWLTPRGPLPWVASAWVMAVACLPLAFAILWTRLRALDGRQVDAALVHHGWGQAVLRVLGRLWAPALAASAGLIFLVCLTDYAVPSLFAADPWALEVLSEFSARHDAARAFGLSVPLVLCALPALAVLVPWLRSAPSQGAPPSTAVSGWAVSVAGIFVAAQWALPLGVLAARAGQTSWTAGGVAPWRDAGTTVAAALISAVTAAVMAAPLALCLARGGRAWLWTLAALPLGAPGVLSGVGLALLWNRDGVPPAYGTPAMLVLAVLARFLPAAILVTAAAWRRVDWGRMEAALVHGGWWRAATRVGAPMLAPGAAAGAAVVFILALSELGATLVVAPPGYGTLAIRLYNYLHYGAAGPVAWVALVITGASLAVGVPLTWWWMKEEAKR